MTRKQAALIFILDLIVPVATVITTVLIAFILSGILIDNGKFPSGDNVYFHIHQGLAMYDSWMNGVPYPILDTKWYNGTELFRYASPIPSVLFAFFMF
ncbi:MAG: hypothetical protein K6F99_05135, partial [Lachnospiraceae bacterium]|nr:hypothetical protein [Lachnospiraceae bacterium]